MPPRKWRDRGKSAIGREAVTMGAIVEHRRAGESGRIGRGRVAIKDCRRKTIRMFVSEFGANRDDIRGLRDCGVMGHTGNERRDIGLGDGIGNAGCAVADRAWAPILSEGVCQGWVDQFEGRAKTVLGRMPFPALVRVHYSAHSPNSPIAIVGILHFVNQIAGGILQSQVVADRAGKSGYEVKDTWIFIGKGGPVGGHDEISA